MTKLMIIESPGKVKKLAEILGPDWTIAASVGHVRDLPQKEMGVAAPDFKPQYELTERGGSVVAKLKGLTKRAQQVYLATDPDREGESISWHLQQCLNLTNPLRVTFNEITPGAVRQALLQPRTIDVKRVAAQEARRVLDRLVGYLVSPELSNQAGVSLSAGRVQSVAVRLVVERERAIEAFKVTQYFGVSLFFAGEKTPWRADWKVVPDFASEDEPYCLDLPLASRIADEVRRVSVLRVVEKRERRSPPAPFTTSTLQQAASVALGLDPKQAMGAAQKLYEQGHITYHRTDNPNVSKESLPDIYAVATKLGLEMADEPRRFKAKEGAQEGHPAITPTHWEVEAAGETPEQQALYELIRVRAIACQLADAQYDVRSVRLEALLPEVVHPLTFTATGRTLVDEGWLRLLAGDQTEEPEKAEPANPVPALREGDKLEVERGELVGKQTRPPARFTEATLVNKLEAEGVGRPATYAAILDNIKTRSYVRVEKKHLVPTDTGELVCDALTGHFEFVELGFTRDVEADLDRIARGEAGFKAVVQRVYQTLRTELSTLQVRVTPKHPCPECGKALRRRKGGSGHFWGCMGYPGCAVTLPDDAGKPGKKKPVEVSAFACAKCAKPLARRQKKGKGGYDFYGCTGFREGCKASYPTKDGTPDFAAAR